MIYKSRAKSKELILLNFLNNRMNLSTKDKQYYYQLKKGYEGEVKFDEFTETLKIECFIINDLLLKFNNTTFQIDSLIITSEKLYMFEVKNFEGDYYYENDKFYINPNTEITNPIHQLSRCESLLKQVLSRIGFNSLVDSSVVFINPEFTLYQAPINKPIIFRAQINRYLNKLNTIPSRLSPRHKQLANKLVSLHLNESPYSKISTYEYEQLEKGITCLKCNSTSISKEGKKCVCSNCGFEEVITNAVKRSVDEFKFLFPKQKITTNLVHDWCKVVTSKKSIRKILSENYKKYGTHQWTYYE